MQEAIFHVVETILHISNVEFGKVKEPKSSQPKDAKTIFHLQMAAEILM